jgi:4-hydroxy-tetrahydrodipicolinate synthase
LHRGGDRHAARQLFDRLAAVLLFSNQHIDISIQFFKRLLQARGIFTGIQRRSDRLAFDETQEKLAAELINHVFMMERGSTRRIQ